MAPLLPAAGRRLSGNLLTSAKPVAHAANAATAITATTVKGAARSCKKGSTPARDKYPAVKEVTPVTAAYNAAIKAIDAVSTTVRQAANSAAAVLAVFEVSAHNQRPCKKDNTPARDANLAVKEVAPVAAAHSAAVEAMDAAEVAVAATTLAAYEIAARAGASNVVVAVAAALAVCRITVCTRASEMALTAANVVLATARLDVASCPALSIVFWR